MKLRGIHFSPSMGASGTQGFFGDGYKFHEYYRRCFPRGFNMSGMTFVANTTTLEKRQGNLPLREDGITPKEEMPRCIYVGPLGFVRGAALNAVDLSGPGAEFLLKMGRWQQRTQPFFISFMAVGSNPGARFWEIVEFIKLLKSFLPTFRARVGLQINFSCPNTGNSAESDKFDELSQESCEVLKYVCAHLPNIPVVPKFSILMRPHKMVELEKYCDAICVSNTIPWNAAPDKIRWNRLFMTRKSPLSQYGGGGLSGKPVLPLVCEWLEEARSVLRTPIIAGGGIMHPSDVHRVTECNYMVYAVSIGTIAMLRPWRVRETIRVANSVL